MTQTLAVRFEQAKEQALNNVAQNIETLFQDKESVDFRFDAFSLWGMNAGAASSAFWKDFPVDGLVTDDWSRGVWTLNKQQALDIARHVEAWNAEWKYDIAWNTPGVQNPGQYRNPYLVAFEVATGTEHEIPVNPGTYKATTSWQW